MCVIACLCVCAYVPVLFFLSRLHINVGDLRRALILQSQAYSGCVCSTESVCVIISKGAIANRHIHSYAIFQINGSHILTIHIILISS